MSTSIRPRSGAAQVAVWEVLKAHVSDQIARGVYPVGEWLPSVRSMSEELGVNRNTVSKVYRALGRDGLVESAQGRGVRVIRKPLSGVEGRATIETAIDRIVREAGMLGLSGEWILGRVGRAIETILAPAPRLAFVECTMPDARKLAADLTTALGVSVTPVDLSDAVADPQQLAGDFDLVTTTFFHYQEVNAALTPFDARVAAIHHTVSHESLGDVTGIPPKSRVVVVGPNDRTIVRFRGVVEDYTDSEVTAYTIDQVDELSAALEKADVAIGVASAVGLLAELAPHIPMITLSFRIEEGSVAELRQYVDRLLQTPRDRLAAV